MSTVGLDKRYLLWGIVVSQPNIVEKLVGAVRRSPKLFRLIKLYYGPSEDEGRSLFYIEINSSEKNAQRLLRIYENYIEVVKVWCKEVNIENNLSPKNYQ
ncbi:MAG: hypothetical protein N3G77_07405 [Nitrososphaeria archaeon]|nr:hypothetical protein [Nitrososphaeria archaeon]